MPRRSWALVVGSLAGCAQVDDDAPLSRLEVTEGDCVDSIAFNDDRERLDVWLARPDGSCALSPSRGLSLPFQEAWISPDLEWVRLCASGTCYLARMNGDEQTRVTDGMIHDDGSHMAVVSPDWQWVAWTAPYEEVGNSRVTVQSFDGLTTISALFEGVGNSHGLHWAPDSAHLALVTAEDQDGYPYLQGVSVLSADLQMVQPPTLRRSGEFKGWSDDGTLALFDHFFSPYGEPHWWVTSVAGGEPWPAWDAETDSEFSANSGAWAPGNHYVGMQRGGGGLLSVDVTTGVAATTWVGDPFGLEPRLIDVSSQGTVALVSRSDYSLSFIDVDGVRRLVEGVTVPHQVMWGNRGTWSPDGTMFASLGMRSDDYDPSTYAFPLDVFVVSRDASTVTWLTETEPGELALEGNFRGWSADSQWVLWTGPSPVPYEAR